MKSICGSKSRPACCRPYSRVSRSPELRSSLYPDNRRAKQSLADQFHGASARHRCGHDGQRKGVAHMPTATTTADSWSK
jgi:hypothetical protein